MTKKKTSVNKLLTATQLEVIKDYIPHGSRRDLASEFGVSKQYVGLVINGKRTSDKISMRALEIALAEKKRRDQRDKGVLKSLKELAS